MVPEEKDGKKIKELLARRDPQSLIDILRRRILNACFGLSALIFFFGFGLTAEAATLHFSPSTGNFYTQNSFTVSVMVSTNQTMNGAEAEVRFPTDKLEVIGVSKRGSIFSLWVQEPSFNNLGPIGVVNFQGVKLNPGFTGNNGKILDISFRVKDTGLANIVFGSGAVLANDGRGSNIISSFGSGIYMLREGTAPAVPSGSTLPAPSVVVSSAQLPPRPTLRHFVQDRHGYDVFFNRSDDGPKWSNSSYAKLTWVPPGEAIGVVTLVDDKPDSDPGKVSEGMIDNKILPMMLAGKHYFHLRYLGANGALGPVLHYPLLIDTRAPKEFNIEFQGNETSARGIYATSNPRPLTAFFSDDELSGIDYYGVKMGDEEWVRADDLARDSPYPLPKGKPNKKFNLIVRAYDKAGNYTDATAQVVILPVARPLVNYYSRRILSPQEALVVEGSSGPAADIEIVLEKNQPVILTTKADDNGDWRLVWGGSLSAGMYAITVKQTIGNGAESLYTDPVYVRVSPPTWRFLWNFMNWLEEGNGYILLVVLLVMQALTYWNYRRLLALARQQMKDTRAVRHSRRVRPVTENFEEDVQS
jgi:hypothetical protein